MTKEKKIILKVKCEKVKKKPDAITWLITELNKNLSELNGMSIEFIKEKEIENDN